MRSQVLEGGTVLFEGDAIGDDRNLFTILLADGTVVPLPEAATMFAYSDGGDVVATVREDFDDDERLLAEVDTGGLTLFDEADDVFNVHFVDDDVVYAARTGSDNDEVEVRRHSVGSDDPPVVEFEEAWVLSGSSGGTFELIDR